MKKLFLIVAALFVAVSFSACSDDDKDGNLPITPANLAGTWEYIHYYSYEKDNGVVDEVEFDVSRTDEKTWCKITFSEDGTFTKEDAYGVDTDIKHYYSIDGNTITKKHVYKDGTSDIEIQTITTLSPSTLVTEEIDDEDGYYCKEIKTYKRI